LPVITGVAPNAGPVAGGTSVTLTGSGFTGATSVTFGGTAATSFTVTSDTTITATAPPHAAGAVNVSVTTVGGTGTAANAYTYSTAPVATSVSPNAGPVVGGTSVTITGSVFTGATSVTFGGVAATSFTVNSDTSITAITPPGALGAVDVVVTSPGGTSRLLAAFTYIASIPMLSSWFVLVALGLALALFAARRIGAL
jgi:hypothetical protein